MPKKNINLPSINEIDFQIDSLPEKKLTSAEKESIYKRIEYLESRNRKLRESNIELESKYIEVEKLAKKYNDEISKRNQSYIKLKEMFDFITKLGYKNKEKKDYYKLLNLWLLKKRQSETKDIDFLKNKVSDLEKKNLFLSNKNSKLENENNEALNNLEKLKHEYNSKKQMFIEQEKKLSEIKKKAINSLTGYQTVKEMSKGTEKRYKEVLARNSFLEEKTKEHFILLKQLREQLIEERSCFYKEMENIKKKNEEKIKSLVEQNTNSELELRSRIKILQTDLERQKKIFKEKERREKEVFSNINEKLKFLIEQ